MRRTWETASSVDHFGLYANCIGSKVGGREDLTWSLISLSKTFMAAEIRAPDRSVVIQACRRVDLRYSDNCGSFEAGRYNRLNMVVKTGARWMAKDLSNRPDMPSGPAALCVFTLNRALLTSCSSTEISCLAPACELSTATLVNMLTLSL